MKATFTFSEILIEIRVFICFLLSVFLGFDSIFTGEVLSSYSLRSETKVISTSQFCKLFGPVVEEKIPNVEESSGLNEKKSEKLFGIYGEGSKTTIGPSFFIKQLILSGHFKWPDSFLRVVGLAVRPLKWPDNFRWWLFFWSGHFKWPDQAVCNATIDGQFALTTLASIGTIR